MFEIGILEQPFCKFGCVGSRLMLDAMTRRGGLSAASVEMARGFNNWNRWYSKRHGTYVAKGVASAPV